MDVVVAGAGPVGLLLACELRLHGAEVVVLERLTEPDETIKAGAINVPSIEALRRRGLLGEIDAYMTKELAKMAHLRQIPGQQPPDLATMRQRMRKIGGHFGGLFKLDPSRLDADDPDMAITDGNALGVVPQVALERILAARAGELGVRVRRGVEVAGFEQDDHEVRVSLAGGEVVRGKYLVGCDGGRSAVRKLAGFEFPGTEPTITGHQALVELDHPERLPTGWNRTEVGMLVFGPQPGRILLTQFDGPPADRDAPVTREELEAGLRRVSGQDVSITAVHSATRFTDNARQASTYRIGRVLLAGDAAHVHSPFGGQGLNLGIGDAVNLGWKLAAVVRGRDAALLDTYTTERHPIAARILEITRAQVALMRPGPHVGALREVVSELMDTPDGNAYFVKMIGGLVQRYDLGGGHPLVGSIMPLLQLADGSTLAEHFADGGAVLLDAVDAPQLRAVAGDRVRVVTAKIVDGSPLTGLLVRPDGYVAWAADDSAEDGVAGLAEALDMWC